jgi:hypothetical protein
VKERDYEFLKYEYNKDEIRELGEALAREAQNVFNLRDQKATDTAKITGQIKAANKRVSELTTKINNGYELKEVECLVIMDTPRQGMKQIRRMDNNEFVRDEAMTFEEMQQNLGFPESDK